METMEEENFEEKGSRRIQKPNRSKYCKNKNLLQLKLCYWHRNSETSHNRESDKLSIGQRWDFKSVEQYGLVNKWFKNY